MSDENPNDGTGQSEAEIAAAEAAAQAGAGSGTGDSGAGSGAPEATVTVPDITSAIAPTDTPLSQPGAHIVAIGDEANLFMYDVDSEGNILNFRGANEADVKN